MQAHIPEGTKIRHRRFVAIAPRFGAFLASCFLCPLAQAVPGGEPLVLDTQAGIHSGAGGTILQSAPLGAAGMVPMATLPGLKQEQQPIVVSPYVEYGGQSTTPATNSGKHRRKPRAPYP
ncbi:hypothetical protein [Caballeronia sp. Lep1P3]|uniref:hypothetical protein n=1 Tax=Caballeronia sp. Lep1P3 TaxID=2878150 RepID=UPI001FD2102D|nr:hypothetical protein [Caballeronia sp. Lep1P3]